jgi:hypothetical protein
VKVRFLDEGEVLRNAHKLLRLIRHISLLQGRADRPRASFHV